MATVRTIFTLIDNMTPKLRQINQGLMNVTTTLVGTASAIAIYNTLKKVVSDVASKVNELTDAYATQYESEVKLYTIMRQRMNATLEEFNAIKALASEMESYGVLSDKVILKGAQELASFVQTEDQIKKMLPAIANLTVQQYGYNASADQMRQITTSIGKMLNGTVSGLSKLGLAFTDEEKKMLKSNDMAKKVEIVYNRIVEKVGDMNKAMGLTNIGKIQLLKNRIESVNEEMGRLVQPLKIVGLQIKLAFQTKMLELFRKALAWVNKHADALAKVIQVLATVSLVALGVGLGYIIGKLLILITLQAIVHWKTTLIIAGILLVLRILNKLGVSIADILGFISGAITYILNKLRNLVAFVWNTIIVPIYNAVAWVVEVIINLVNGRLINVLKLIATKILEILLTPVRQVVSIINKVIQFFGGKGKLLEEEFKNLDQKMYDWSHPQGTYKVERLNKMEYSNAGQKAIEVGTKTTNTLNKVGEYLKSATSGFQVEMPEVDVVNGAMAVYDQNLIDIAEDYKELLSRRARERFNLQLARVSPSITIEKVDIHKEADAENVLNTMAKAIEDFSNSSLSFGRGRVAYGN